MLAALRAHGATPETVVGYLAWSLGLAATSAPCPAHALVADFAWERLHREPWALPEGGPPQLLAVG